MKLVHLEKGNIESYQTLEIVAGTLSGFKIITRKIHPPDAENKNGKVGYVLEDGKGAGFLDPRCLNCYWFPDDSLLASITYDNELSFRRTLDDIFNKLKGDKREIRSAIIGQKEWAKIQDFCSYSELHQKVNGVTAPYYDKVLLRPMPYDTMLIIEHADENPFASIHPESKANFPECFKCVSNADVVPAYGEVDDDENLSPGVQAGLTPFNCLRCGHSWEGNWITPAPEPEPEGEA